MKAILIENAKSEIVECDEQYFYDFAHHYFGKDVFVEKVHLSDNCTLFMAIDDDGWNKNLPLNFYMEMNSENYPVQAILGKGIVIRVKEADLREEIYDWEVIDVTNDDIKKIEKFLDEDYQLRLAVEFAMLYN